MPTKGSQHAAATGSLAARLRDLREHEFRRLTQEDLARALGGAQSLSGAAISTWENPGSGRLPPEHRLAAYARLFCTMRSFSTQGLRMLSLDELTESERTREAELLAELLALREQSNPGEVTAPTGQPWPTSIWHVPPGDPISIVCSEARRPPHYADPDDQNFVRIARYGDLDTLLEVFGQVRADNPVSKVRVMPPGWLRADHALNHLIIIGGATSRLVTQTLFRDSPIPVVQETEENENFRCEIDGKARTFVPTFEGGTLAEDVGFFLHGPHPYVTSRRVTICNGLTTRGVHGAALCFIDPHVRERNEDYIRSRFTEDATFCMLFRVPVVNLEPLPPDLSRAEIRLYEWSSKTGPRW